MSDTTKCTTIPKPNIIIIVSIVNVIAFVRYKIKNIP